MEATPPPQTSSPKWGSTTKLIAGLTAVAIIAGLLVRFTGIIGPLILSFILAYLLQPLASRINLRFKLSWRASVAIIFLVVVVLLAGLIFLVGLAVVQQIQSLIDLLQRLFNELPALVSNLTSRQFAIGPLKLDLTQFDLTTLTNQLLGSAQAILGRVGSLVSTVATSALVTLGYIAFILIIAYFLLSETSQVRKNMVTIEIPGYGADVRRLGRALTRIWDAFLRGQLVIFILVVISYYLLMTILGMRFTFGIALMAGLARFVPYVGPFIAWTTAGLVAFFATSNYFGLQSWAYTLLVVGLCLLIDQVYDHYIVPRFMGRALNIHPAAILVAALVATSLLGFIGLVLAAPVLATLVLLGRYMLRKMFDLDPWPEPEQDLPVQLPSDRLFRRLRAWWQSIRRH